MRTSTYLLVALSLWVAGCAPSVKPEPVWIGHVAPLSGPQRERGEEAVRAMQFALERADGFGVGGRAVGVRHVDSASPAARAETTRLLAVNRVCALILGPGVANVDELLAAARSHGAPVIVLDEMAHEADYAGVVPLGADPARRGEKLAEVAREKKYKKVAIVVDASGAGNAKVAEAFAAAWRKGGGEVRRWAVTKEEAPPDPAIDDWGADAILEVLPGWVVLDRFPGKDPAATSVTDFPGVGGVPEAGRKTLASLEKTGPAGRDAALALDGIGLLMEAMKRMKPPPPDKFREGLREALDSITEFEGVTGTVTWEGGRAVRPLFVVKGAGAVK